MALPLLSRKGRNNDGEGLERWNDVQLNVPNWIHFRLVRVHQTSRL